MIKMNLSNTTDTIGYPKFQIDSDKAGEFRFNLFAKNGENILRSSEGYTTKENCKKGIASVKVNSPIDSRYLRKVASNNQPFFVLIAANREPLGMSEFYSSTYNRNQGIEAVKRDAPGAPVEDLTLLRTY